MKIVRLTKLRDYRYGFNELNDGKIWIGTFCGSPAKNYKFILGYLESKYHCRGYLTSPVLEVINENRFRTHHSEYLWEIIKKEEYG